MLLVYERVAQGKSQLLLQDMGRLVWQGARRYLKFTGAVWAYVFFVDEIRIKLCGPDRRDRVYRRRGEQNSEACLFQADKFGSGSILMWVVVSIHTKTPIIPIQGNLNALRYQTDIIQPILIQSVRANR
jgi:hypothetical protein